ncbi:Hypothetical predicted protein [Olea europaea subsp. europaea]|uniref:LCR n=1 Tax=Olea europaea subsp. europaea TaxID=158383 RepID=A0A8S0UHQ5_OLEEU|nr:Hypothetical predicted protein [Olea europaea subsp. europaea]
MENPSLHAIAKKLAKFTVLAILLISIAFIYVGEAEIQCQGKCEDLPDCDVFCRRSGFQTGKCYPPLYQYCCCST